MDECIILIQYNPHATFRVYDLSIHRIVRTPDFVTCPVNHIFALVVNHIKLFNNVLKLSNLKYDRDGKPRTAYSLRHTYICMRLSEGADIYNIAKNCRTSVEMIEKFYASHIKEILDAELINTRRPRQHLGKAGAVRMD